MDNTSNSSFKCVTWDEKTKEWNQKGIIVERTKFCPNYISCFTTHLSDFTVLYDEKTIPPSNASFDDVALRTNAAWWLYFIWILSTGGMALFIFNKRKDEPELPQT